MKVKDVMLKYHKRVPFPWTPEKIEEAGYEFPFFMNAIARELKACEDVQKPNVQKVLRSIDELYDFYSL